MHIFRVFYNNARRKRFSANRYTTLGFMNLHINGQPREFPDSLSLASLVATLGMKSDRVAVELNLEIVPRASWDSTILKDGDRLEIVHFVGGGSTARD